MDTWSLFFRLNVKPEMVAICHGDSVEVVAPSFGVTHTILRGHAEGISMCLCRVWCCVGSKVSMARGRGRWQDWRITSVGPRKNEVIIPSLSVAIGNRLNRLGPPWIM